MTEKDIIIQDLRRENAELRARVPQWISVKDRLPKDGEPVIVIVSGKVGNITLVDAIELADFSLDEGWILEMWPEWEDPKVIYWMPLPEPPEEDEK